jgi:probable HAF family extracellular repeat protein
MAINNRGQIVGFATWSDGDTKAVMWEHDQMVVLDTREGLHSEAYDINDHGQVVGHQFLPKDRWPRMRALSRVLKSRPVAEWDPDAGELKAVVWDTGVRIELGTVGSANSVTTAINNRGDIVGSVVVPKHLSTRLKHSNREAEVRAALWQNQHLRGWQLTVLETLTPAEFWCLDKATSINNHGVIVGCSRMHDYHTAAVQWEGHHVVKLPEPAPKDYADPIFREEMEEDGNWPEFFDLAVNDQGQIVGGVEFDFGDYYDYNRYQCLLWRDGNFVDLGPLGNRPAINNRGQILGVKSTSADYARASVWDGAQLIDLATPTGRASYANAINDLGQVVGSFDQVVGSAKAREGSRRACLWE